MPLGCKAMRSKGEIVKTSEKSIARFTVRNVPGMTKEGRRLIAEWLIRNAKSIVREGDKYTDKYFVATYGSR